MASTEVRISPPNHRRVPAILGHPNILTIRRPAFGAETYLRALLPLGHGIPLWPGIRYSFPPEYFIRGTGIGDVGVITPDDGTFFFFFNIFEHGNHPMQFRIPNEFRPFEPRPETIVDHDFHPPETVIASPGIDTNVLSETPQRLHFSSNEDEGAILILNDGASREDMVDPNILNDYIARHAPHWYQYMKQMFSYIHNGTLMVVTGCDKASDWAVAAFPRAPDTHFSIEYVALPLTESRQPQWSGASRLGRSFVPNISGDDELRCRSECVFVRGIKVSVNTHLWKEIIWKEITPLLPSSLGVNTYIKPNPSRLRNFFHGLRNLLCIKSEFRIRQYGRIHNPIFFQPTFLIAEALLKLFPDANMALVNDSSWCRAAQGGYCTMDEMEAIVDRVFDTHRVQEHEGVLSLVPQANTTGDKSKRKRGTWALYQFELF